MRDLGGGQFHLLERVTLLCTQEEPRIAQGGDSMRRRQPCQTTPLRGIRGRVQIQWPLLGLPARRIRHASPTLGRADAGGNRLTHNIHPIPTLTERIRRQGDALTARAAIEPRPIHFRAADIQSLQAGQQIGPVGTLAMQGRQPFRLDAGQTLGAHAEEHRMRAHLDVVSHTHGSQLLQRVRESDRLAHVIAPIGRVTDECHVGELAGEVRTNGRRGSEY